MGADDAETPLPSGWLPPRPGTPEQAPPPRPPDAWPREPAQSVEPSSRAVVFAIGIGVFSLLVLLMSLGRAFYGSLLLSAVALVVSTRLRQAILAGGRPGRESQARAAVIVAWIGVALAILAGIMWVVLWANGVTFEDVQDAIERARDRS
jgi:hypothetical protein